MSNNNASPGSRLRQAWTRGPFALPGVFNALVAKMAERLGFEAIYLSGGALSAATGLPDVGLTTVTEFVDERDASPRRVRCLCCAMPIPASVRP